MPHPDDIVIDMQAGRAWVRAPMTAEVKDKWDQALAYRDELQREFAEELERSTTGDAQDFWRKQALFTQHLHDRINGRLPPRYQRHLQHRLCPKPDEDRAMKRLMRKRLRTK